MRTSIPTILSFLLSILVLVWGALVVIGIIDLQYLPEQYDFLNLPSFAIVIGGVLSSIFISTPFQDVLTSLRNSMRIFSQTNITEESLQRDIEKVMDWKRMINADRNRSFLQLKNEYEGTFEGFIFSILDTNYPTETIREIGESNIEDNYARKTRINQIIAQMGKISPVFGMMGTLFGLIIILSGFEDIDYLLTGLAAALMTTFYGIAIGNFVFLPVSRKLNNNAALNYFRDKLILEGIILIEEGNTSLQIYDRLTAHVQSNNSKSV
ncbi:MAG: MotA/TolQ/ExbB proton channel family protein [Balneolaceae bacterium]